MEKIISVKKFIICLIGAVSIISVKHIYADATGLIVYDGNQRLTIVPNQIVEFTTINNPTDAAVRKLDSSAQVLVATGSVTIWRIKNEIMTKSLAQGILPPGLNGNFSPLLRDASGRKKSLPGNVIVYMDKNWSKDAVHTWAKSQNVIIIKCLSEYNNMYLIKSVPGMPSLNLAVGLRSKAGVLKAVPDWWMEVYRR